MPRHGRIGLITTIEELKARCDVDPTTGCWHWRGALTGKNRLPAIHAYDHALGDKRTMSGPRAVWNIAHGEAPRLGWLVFRRCVNHICLNPVHLGQARSRKEIGEHVRLSHVFRGTNIEANRKNLTLAWAARGIEVTPADVVREIRAADASVPGIALAARFGILPQTVSRIRRGKSHRYLLPQQEAA